MVRTSLRKGEEREVERKGLLSALVDAEDLFLAQDHVLDAVDGDLVAGVLAEEDAVALLDLERADLAVLEVAALADGDDLALLRLLLGGLGDEQAAGGL